MSKRFIPLLSIPFMAGSAYAVEPPQVQFSLAPKSEQQPGGPDYDFRIGKFEIRNDEFVAFLNDALDHLDDERGRRLFFDSESGEVRIHSQVNGAVGTGGSGVIVFDPGVAGRIELQDGRYVVAAGYQDHPVVGVSWYGALKFCNWLTLANGFGDGDRVYGEGVSSALDSWRPVTIAEGDWAVRDLNESERSALVEKRGFRLPMDGGVDEAHPYGEWYKAASARFDGSGSVLFDALYGFGRSETLSPADANFYASLDPFESGTTPVGFYDGVNLLTNQVPTSDTDNAFGIHDLSGNVWEWLSDLDPAQRSRRRTRGGSWQSGMESLWISPGSSRAAGTVVNSTGFRVVQSVLEPLLVTPRGSLVLSGPWGGPWEEPFEAGVTFRVMNMTGGSVGYTIGADVPWLHFANQGGALGPHRSFSTRVTATSDCTAALSVGEHVGVVTVEAGDAFEAVYRTVRWTVDEPVTVSPTGTISFSQTAGRAVSPESVVVRLTNASDAAVEWTASWVESAEPPTGVAWLTLNGSATTSGIVVSHTDAEFNLGVDAAAANGLSPGEHFARLLVVDECTGETIERTVRLALAAPFRVEPPGEIRWEGPLGGPFTETPEPFTVRNQTAQALNWSVSICDAELGCPAVPTNLWLSLAPVEGGLSPLSADEVEAEFTNSVLTLPIGSHTLLLRFSEPSTGFFVDRRVALSVQGLSVTPTEAARASGPRGGPFTPATSAYTLRNPGLPELHWTAAAVFDDGAPPWFDVQPTKGILLDAGAEAEVTIALNAEALLLAPGTYRGELRVTSLGQTASREVTLLITGEHFSLPMVNVPQDAVPTNSPPYFFRIGRYEVTNAEYVRFLNDALRNKNSPGGQYLYHDVDSGDVYLHNAQPGEEGTIAPNEVLTTRLFQSSASRIQYVEGEVEPYVVDSGYEFHPVVGVSWYGAVKFCNWLTLIQGMPSSELVYAEGPTTGDWMSIPFDPAIPDSNRHGFRLPRDGGVGGASPANEWYKAASRKLESGATAMVYGFGRNTLTSSDANYLDSGDSSTESTTPVGFYNGVRRLADGRTTTLASLNAFGAYDLCGNVAEWTHERDATGGATRGGHFLTPASFPTLRNDVRETVAPDNTLSYVGFRIAQSLTPVSIQVLQDESSLQATGIVGGPFSSSNFSLQIVNDAPYTLDALDITRDVSWLAPEPAWPSQLPPQSTTTIPLMLTESAEALSLSPSPPGSLSRVPFADVQPGGPAYDFWISTTEVTNDQFVAFLNDTLGNRNNLRGAFLYHDTDSGSVYLHDVEESVEGTEAPSPRHTVVFYNATAGRIRRQGDRYAVQTGFGRHPVVGVSWYGAVKYCNWLTLFSGLPSSARAYHEGPTIEDWRPSTADDATWMTVGLTDDQRERLATVAIGYRLPMDPLPSAPSAFGEWFKAATARKALSGEMLFDSVFGFGRNELAMTSANYLQSGDATVEGTNEVGYFDGIHFLADGVTRTLGTENGYGLADLCGNVAEWTSEPFALGEPTLRAVRGGSWTDAWNNPLLTNAVRQSVAADATPPTIGFRVVRGAGHVATLQFHDAVTEQTHTRHFVLELQEPLTLSPEHGLAPTALFCQDLSDRSLAFILTNQSAAAIPWSAAFTPQVDWVSLDGIPGGTLEGELAATPGISKVLNVSINSVANTLPPGVHSTLFVVQDVRTGAKITRPVRLDIEHPFDITPEPSNPRSEFTWGWESAPDLSAYMEFMLSRKPDISPACELSYSISTTANWLTLAGIPPGTPLSGSMPPSPGAVGAGITTNDEARHLPVGDHTAYIDFSMYHPLLTATAPPIRHEIVLHIVDPLRIVQDEEPWTVCCAIDGPPFPSLVYTLHNDHALHSVSVGVTSEVDWLTVEPSSAAIEPQDTAVVRIAMNERAVFPHGDYPAQITFTNELTGAAQTRNVLLQIRENLSVIPLAGFESAGPSGGPFLPTHRVFTLRNPAAKGATVQWRASVDQPWLMLDPLTPHGGVLSPGGEARIALSIVTDQVPVAPAGSVESLETGILTIEDMTDSETHVRTVQLNVTNPQGQSGQCAVDGMVLQPNGPQYTFSMGTAPVTNAEFVVFLNDALRNLNHPRGQHLLFDSTTGNIFLNSQVGGMVQAQSGGAAPKVFFPGIGGQITFDGTTYQVTTSPIDYTQHPVTGVSWYGAMKYCNWLTLDQGGLPSDRCYVEGTSADAHLWRPTSISANDWTARDLNSAERTALVHDCRGFRLPMDNGYANATASADAADEFNEWFKAAAWSPTLRQNTLYGFGRSVLTGADANFKCSGDPFENATQCIVGGSTPVGFFDGSVKAGGFQTNAGANGFGLLDMSGNVNQWMQDRYAPPATMNRRTLRGGSWNDPITAESLKNNTRVLFAAPDTLSRQIGFRVLRVPPIGDGDFDGNGVVELADLLPIATCAAGPEASPTNLCAAFDFDQDGDVDLADYAEFIPLITIPASILDPQ